MAITLEHLIDKLGNFTLWNLERRQHVSIFPGFPFLVSWKTKTLTKKLEKPGEVVHTFNPSPWEAVADDLWGHTGLQSEFQGKHRQTLSWKKKKKKSHKRLMNIGHLFSKKSLLSNRITAFSVTRKWHTRDVASCIRESKVYASQKRHDQERPFCSSQASVLSPGQKHMQQWSLWARYQLTHVTGSGRQQDFCYLLRQWLYSCRLESLCESWSSRPLINSQ